MRTLIGHSSQQAPPDASPLLEIANVIVHLYKDAFGRGPTKARAHFSGSDTLVVLLEDVMTAAERQLVALGEHARVSEQRLFLQLALEDRKRSEVERVLKRRALACISGTDPGHDLAAEVLLLEPRLPDPQRTPRTHHTRRVSSLVGAKSERARPSTSSAVLAASADRGVFAPVGRGIGMAQAATVGRWVVAKDHGPSVKDDKQYEGLRNKGMSKSRAAAISNSRGSSSRGGKKSAS